MNKIQINPESLNYYLNPRELVEFFGVKKILIKIKKPKSFLTTKRNYDK